MNHFQIVTSGMKIRQLRNKFNLKQQDLAGKDITRNLISLIENDKATLTSQTAELIANNINCVCKDRNINFIVSADYLVENIEDQLKKILTDFKDIILLKENEIIYGEYDNDILEIEKLLKNYDLKEEKFVIYTMMANLYEKYKNYQEAYIYYIKAYENSNKILNDSSLSKVIINLGYCCIRLNRYQEAINFNKLASIYNERISDQGKFIIKFNTSLAYKKLQKYSECISELRLLESTFSNILQDSLINKFNAKLLEANCYREMKRYNDAIDEYINILNFLKDDNLELTIYIYTNLIELYIDLNDTSNLNLYIEKCLYYIEDYYKVKHKKYSSQIYNTIAIGAYTIKNIDLSKEFFIKSIEASRGSNNYELLEDSFIKLLDIFIDSRDSDSINRLKNQLCELISLKSLPLYNVLVLKIINYYNSIGESDKISDLINFIFNIKD